MCGIHSFNKGFYSRNRAYPLLGIDTFISDEDFVNPIYYDKFIKDTEITKQVKALLDENKKNFITISTMGTHPPYNYFMFDEYDEWITVEGLNEEYTLVFNNYIQKLRVLDQMFGEMVECIQESGTNTLLIAYGDHYPHMYQTLESIGLIHKNDKNITPQEYPNLFETPYIIYSTCDENISVREKMTPNSLGIYILENVKLENIPWFYQVIYEYCLNHKSVEDYHMVQYDEMFGEKYWRNMNGEGE